jgi:TPR repeat protein
VMYESGQGVLQDEKQAVDWYRKAAEQGYARAQLNLGLMYESGKGVLEDDKQAVDWYRKAAKQGYARAQLNLGLMYAAGEGVLQDIKQTYMWLNLARYNGADTKKVFDLINSEMASKSINEAQEMSKLCLDSNYKNCG